MVMGECKDRQKKFCIAQTYYTHFQRGYGRLQLGDVYTCHGFLQRTHELEEVNSKTFFHKLTKWFVNKRFGNPLQLTINIIHETPNMTICNFKHASLGVTKI